jgi:hypothetical protein
MTRADHAPAIAELIFENHRGSIGDGDLTTMWPLSTPEERRRGRLIALELLKLEEAELNWPVPPSRGPARARVLAPLWVALAVLVLMAFALPWWRFWLWASRARGSRRVW